jgi:hypothetical protein
MSLLDRSRHILSERARIRNGQDFMNPGPGRYDEYALFRKRLECCELNASKSRNESMGKHYLRWRNFPTSFCTAFRPGPAAADNRPTRADTRPPL